MSTASTGFTLLTAARLLDGSGAPPLEGAALLIENDLIARVGRQGDAQAPSSSFVSHTDYGDATILPGLVDAHTHLLAPGDGTAGDDFVQEADELLLLQGAKNARTILHSGVTTVRENGAKNRLGFSLQEAIRRGLAVGPRSVVCGRPITMTGGHMYYFGSEADGTERVRTEVRKLLKEGADYIKIVASGGSTRTSDPRRASYTVAELSAITDEARRHGKLTAAHCTCTQSVENCLEAGVDMIIHCVFAEPDGTLGFRLDLVDRLVASGVWVNPTLYIIKAVAGYVAATRAREGRSTPHQEALLQRAGRELEARLQTVGKMIRAGIRLCAGSDSPWLWYPPGGFVHEIQMMAEAGLSNGEAIVSGTSGAAESIGAGDVAGRLVAGRQADVLVVAGDPLGELARLGDILDVYQAGRRVDRGDR